MIWSAIFMGVAMFCLGGTLQYFSVDEAESGNGTTSNEMYHNTSTVIG